MKVFGKFSKIFVILRPIKVELEMDVFKHHVVVFLVLRATTGRHAVPTERRNPDMLFSVRSKPIEKNGLLFLVGKPRCFADFPPQRLRVEP